MRILGIVSLAATLFSLFFWSLSWLYFTFLIASYPYDSPLRYVAQSCAILSTLTEYLAIGLLSIGLIVISKRVVKS